MTNPTTRPPGSPSARSRFLVFWFCSLIKLRHGGYRYPPRPAPSALGGLVENICLCDGHLFSWGLRSHAFSWVVCPVNPVCRLLPPRRSTKSVMMVGPSAPLLPRRSASAG